MRLLLFLALVFCLLTRAPDLERLGTDVWVALLGDALVEVASRAASSLWVSFRDGAEVVAFWVVVPPCADSHNIHYPGGKGVESSAPSASAHNRAGRKDLLDKVLDGTFHLRGSASRLNIQGHGGQTAGRLNEKLTCVDGRGL